MLAEVSQTDRENEIRGEMLAQMKEILQEKGLDYVWFSVTFVPKILPDPKTGKKPLILKYQEYKEEEMVYQIADYKKRAGKAG